MAADRAHYQMFQLITARVSEEWLIAKQLNKDKFLDQLQDAGCRISLDKGAISIECTLNQLLNIHRQFEEDKESDKVEPIFEAFESKQNVADKIRDEMILDENVWDYMKQIYGSELAFEQNKYKVSLEESSLDDGVITIILKSKLQLYQQCNIMNIQRQLLEMKDYLSSLESFVVSSVRVEIVGCTLENFELNNIYKQVKEKYGDVITSKSGRGIQIIGPPESCQKVKKFLRTMKVSKSRLTPERELDPPRLIKEDNLLMLNGYTFDKGHNSFEEGVKISDISLDAIIDDSKLPGNKETENTLKLIDVESINTEDRIYASAEENEANQKYESTLQDTVPESDYNSVGNKIHTTIFEQDDAPSAKQDECGKMDPKDDDNAVPRSQSPKKTSRISSNSIRFLTSSTILDGKINKSFEVVEKGKKTSKRKPWARKELPDSAYVKEEIEETVKGTDHFKTSKEKLRFDSESD